MWDVGYGMWDVGCWRCGRQPSGLTNNNHNNKQDGVREVREIREVREGQTTHF